LIDTTQATITTNWDKRSKITIPSASLPLLPPAKNADDQVTRVCGVFFVAVASPNTPLSLLQELLVFTCDKSHMWTRQVFFETVLPKFKALITTLPVDLSMTAQFLISEYHLVRSRPSLSPPSR